MKLNFPGVQGHGIFHDSGENVSIFYRFPGLRKSFHDRFRGKCGSEISLRMLPHVKSNVVLADVCAFEKVKCSPNQSIKILSSAGVAFITNASSKAVFVQI